MTSWTGDVLDRIGAADELRLTSSGAEDGLRPFGPIWVVRAGHDLDVRSCRVVGGRSIAAGARSTVLRPAPR